MMEMDGIVSGESGWTIKVEDGLSRRKIGLMTVNGVLHIYFTRLGWEAERKIAELLKEKLRGAEIIYRDDKYCISLFDAEIEDLKKIFSVNRKKKEIVITNDAVKRLIEEAEKAIEKEREEEQRKREMAEKRKRRIEEQKKKFKESRSFELYKNFDKYRKCISDEDREKFFELAEKIYDEELSDKELTEILSELDEIAETVYNKYHEQKIKELTEILSELEKRYESLEEKYNMLVELVRQKLSEDEIIDFFIEREREEKVQEIRNEFSELFDDEDDYDDC